MIVIKKGLNNINSNLVLDNSYENKRYLTKIKRNPSYHVRYFLKYKILFKIYTLILFSINLIKKIILFRY